MTEWSEPVAAGEPWNFDGEPVLEGVYRGAERKSWEQDGRERSALLHQFEQASGMLVDVWGSAELDRLLKTIEPGTLCRVQYLGREFFDKDGEERSIKRFELRTALGAPVQSSVDDEIPF